MSGPRNFKELIVWRKAIDLAKRIYEVTQTFPSDERFGLVSQMRRCSVSIPSNIAEGQARFSTGEFKQFLGVARGSLAELETQNLLATELGMIGQDCYERIDSSLQEVGRLLNGLIKSLPH